MTEVLYIGSADEHVYSFDCADGRLVWRFGGEGGFGSTQAYYRNTASWPYDDTIYIGGWCGNVYAIDAHSGKQRWKYKTNGDIESSPCIANDTVYIGSTDNLVYAFTLDGELKWCAVSGYKIESTPVYDNGAIIIGSEDGRVYAIDEDGDERWRVETNDEVRSSGACADGYVYIGSSNKTLYKIDTKTGEIIWTSGLHAPTDSTPTINGNRLYIGTIKRNHDDKGEGNVDTRRRCVPSPGAVQAFDTETGEQIWKFLTGESVWCQPAVNNGLVYVSCHDSYIYAIDEQTGKCRWKYRCDSYSNSSPAIGSDGTVYVGADDKKVHALDGSTGEKKWEFLGTDRFGSSPTIVSFVDFRGDPG